MEITLKLKNPVVYDAFVNGVRVGEISKQSDETYVWWPHQHPGIFTAQMLDVISARLKELNRGTVKKNLVFDPGDHQLIDWDHHPFTLIK